MNDDKQTIKQSVDLETWPIGIAILLVFFYGEPDLCDALIHYLMQAKP